MKLGRTLIFGDSHTARPPDNATTVAEVTEPSNRNSAPGDLLASLLRENGATAVRIDARMGRSAYNFFTTREPHEALLAADVAWKPDTLIIFLGTNDLGLNMKIDGERMKAIRNTFPKAQVFAIGPPAFKDPALMAGTDAVYKMLHSVVGAPRVVDARPLSADLLVQGRAGDGVHFNSAGAKVFAPRLARAILDRVTASVVVETAAWMVGLPFGLLVSR